MVDYKAPLEDYRFLMHELFDCGQMTQSIGHPELDSEFLDMMLEEWSTFIEEVWLPTNRLGDEVGLEFSNGDVKLAPELIDAWKQTIDSGWMAAPCSEEWGGQELPLFFRTACDEVAIAGNMALAVIGALNLGVYDLIHSHGAQHLQEEYLGKLSTGEWCGTMALTEPHCGTDLGILKTKAESREDGSWSLSGTKIFITGGEHNLSENIVHMVLARLPGAPEGIKGVSLFCAPKFLPDGNGGLGERNGVTCVSIEKKMGLHSSPTCVLNFDDATGWLVGEPHKGMSLMFEMMNRERLSTGMMGLGLGEAAYQNALAWAKERRQGRDLRGPKDLKEDADNILRHPDVRRMLLRSKVNMEGMRAMGLYVGMQLDLSENGEGEEKEQAKRLVALLTPIVKAHFSDVGAETTDECIQVLGGAGYIRESGVEQYFRDVRIARIWEGTNGIQALDLVGRKLPMHMARGMRDLLWPILEFIEEHRDNPDMAPFTKPLYQGVRGLQQLTLLLMSEGMANPYFLAAGATEYTRYFGNVVLAWMWAKIALVCLPKQDESPFHAAKIASAKVFFERIYPETISLAAKVQAGHRSLMEYPMEMM